MSLYLAAWNARARVLFPAVVLLLSGLVTPVSAQEHPVQKRVLVLYALRAESPALAIQERLYRQDLAAAPGGVDYYSEYIDVQRFEDVSFQEAFADFIRRKYRGQHFDLLIANGPTVLSFAVKVRPEMFPHTPIIFNGVRTRTVSNSTGLFYMFPMKDSIDLALQLQPTTQYIFAVCGSSETDKYYENAFRRQVPVPPPGVALSYRCGRPVQELTETLADLPPNSIIFFISMSSDVLGNQFVSAEIPEQLAAMANAPIYSWNQDFSGIFGGALLSTEPATHATAALALRVLRGEDADSIPIATVDASVRQVDWRQLRRWNISERRVPLGVDLQHRDPSFFERYRAYVVGAIVLISLQSGLIAGLLIQLKQRRRAERTLRESEAALRESNSQIQDLAGRLITAQEAERARIARELHDDISQQLAGISIAVSGAKRMPDALSSGALQETLAALQRRIIGLSEEIRMLSHDLHPGILEHAGLVDALRSHCAEVARQHDLDIEVEVDSDPGAIDLPTALCLYRVAQESLRNIGKHAQAHHVLVAIKRHQDEVHLAITDDGRGFDPGGARQTGRGLGLRSIEERVRLARGHVRISSAPERGTTVSVLVKVANDPVTELATV